MKKLGSQWVKEQNVMIKYNDVESIATSHCLHTHCHPWNHDISEIRRMDGKFQV